MTSLRLFSCRSILERKSHLRFAKMTYYIFVNRWIILRIVDSSVNRCWKSYQLICSMLFISILSTSSNPVFFTIDKGPVVFSFSFCSLSSSLLFLSFTFTWISICRFFYFFDDFILAFRYSYPSLWSFFSIYSVIFSVFLLFPLLWFRSILIVLNLQIEMKRLLIRNNCFFTRLFFKCDLSLSLLLLLRWS